MKTHGDTVTLEKFLRPPDRGLSPELAFAHFCTNEKAQSITATS